MLRIYSHFEVPKAVKMKTDFIFAFLVGLVLCVLSSPGTVLARSKGDCDVCKDGSILGPVTSKTTKELIQHVTDGEYLNAVTLIKAMDKALPDELITETVQKLLDSTPTAKCNVISLAYKLWSGGNEDIVEKHFPDEVQNVLDKGPVTIVNKGYDQALKLDWKKDGDGDRLAWGDSKDKTSKRVSWKFIPIWENNELTYKIYNLNTKMYLKLAVATDGDGDRRAYGSDNSDTDRHRFYLEPNNEGGELVYFIINKQYSQGLKLIVAKDSVGDRALMSHNGDIHQADTPRFRWVISKFE